LKKTTRMKILEAASEVFGDKGYRAATVRDICKKAGVNQALINYYFNSKQQLYNEIFSSIVESVAGSYPLSDFVRPEMTKEEKLKGLVITMMNRAFGLHGIGGSKARLNILSREMIEPTDAMDMYLVTRISEIRAVGYAIVTEFVGDKMSDENKFRHVLSIVGQCMFPMFENKVLMKTDLMKEPTKDNMDIMVEHIYSFSLNALNGAVK